jgi:hypothetical protein
VRPEVNVSFPPVAGIGVGGQYCAMRPRAVDLSYELKRDKRHVRRELAGSLMSSTKWRTVIETLAAPQLAVKQVVVKFIDGTGEHRMAPPWTSSVPYDYVEGSFGPFPIVSIEWLEVPAEAIFKTDRQIPAKRIAQDIHAVRAALESTGKQLPLTETASGLRITGHVR